MALLLLRTLVLAFIYLVEAALVLVFIRVDELPLHILIPDVVVAGKVPHPGRPEHSAPAP